MNTTAITKRRKHFRAGDRVWGLIRADYERGFAVDLLAKHYGPHQSTIYRRAKLEGWVRPETRQPDRLDPALAPSRLAPPPAEAAAETGPPDAAAEAPTPPPPPATLGEAIARTIEAAVAATLEDRPAHATALAALAERLIRLQARTEADDGPDAGFTPARDIIAVLAERLGVEA